MDSLYLLIWVLLIASIWYVSVKLARLKWKKPWVGHLIGAPLGLIVAGVLIGPLLKTTDSASTIGSAETTQTSAISPEQKAAEVAAKVMADRLSAARGACMLILKESLNDPYSADFGLTTDWPVNERKDGTILVRPVIRAKNAFGAYVKSTWICITRKEGTNIRVLSLKQIHP